MKHLGDICKINGAEIEPVNCITGGSPCQDLSIAGKRAGLAGERSGLFMEQVRIVKEMRERDKRNGRTGDMVRPRFLVWENVPGAFSSNGGRDFQAVLEEIIHIAEPTVSVPRFEGKWTKAGAIDGDGWSVAWRTHDAQYWGVPQRRRRISVVADFGGQSAGEILFERQGLPGDIAESGASGEGPAEAAEAGASYAVRIRGGCDGGGKGALVQEDKSGTLGTGNDQTIFCLQGNGIDRADTAGCNGKGWREDTSYTLNTIDRPAVCAGFKPNNGEKARSIGYAEEQSTTLNAECGGNKPAVLVFATNQREEVREIGEKSVTLAAEPGMHCQTFVAQKLPAVLCLNDQGGNVMGVSHDVSGTLREQENWHQPTILDMSHACDVIRDCGEVAPNLQARMGTGGNQVPLTYQMQGFGDYRDGNVASSCKQRDFKDGTDLAITNMAVRRLTPMECERLQGFPDGWTDIGDWIDEEGRTHKQADSPRYKALGNSIALPFWYWMFCRMAEHLPEKATLGSLFDGIGGFPLCWESIHGKGTARWASEIEKFPMAVTKLRFPEEA